MSSATYFNFTYLSFGAFKKWLHFFCFFIFLSSPFFGNAQVNLTFTKGYLGIQNNNPITTVKNITSFSTIGIARVSFIQSNATSFGGASGNELNGIIKIYLAPGATSPQAINSVITLNASLNWREISSTVKSFGFIFSSGQNATITNGSNYTISSGTTANVSSTLGLLAYNSSFVINNGDDRNVNSTLTGLITDFNAAFSNFPQPATITLNNAAITEGQNLVFVATLTNATTVSPTAYMLTKAGTASATGDYSTTYTFSNGVVDNRDGTINVPSGVSSFTITVSTIDDLAIEDTETLIVRIGNASATGEILDNEAHPTITSTNINSFTVCSGSTIKPKFITVSGANLVSNVNITASGGLQLSVAENGTYSSTISLTPNSGTLSNTNVFVKITNTTTGTSGTLNLTSDYLVPKSIIVKYNTDNALNFDGIDDVVSIPDNDSLDLTSNYTIEAWIKPTSFSVFAGIVSKCHSAESKGYSLKLNGTDDYSGISFDGMSTSNEVLSLNNWYHVAGVNQNGTRKIYINGIEKAITGTPLVTAINTDSVKIGQDFSSSGERFFKGSIDEVRIWKTARTASEILANMNVMLTGNEPGLVAHYNFDQGVANGTNTSTINLVNNTTNSLAGTITGMTLSGRVSNFVEGYMPPIIAADSLTEVLKGKTLALSNILGGGVWSSSNTNIATVNSSTGVVTGVAAGDVSITYTICDKKVSYNLNVTVIITTGTFTTFTSCYGYPSLPQSLLVNAVSLTNNLVVTAPVGYEVSNTITGTYSSSINLSPTSGTISNTSVFVRLSSKAFNGDHGNLIFSSANVKSRLVPIKVASVKLINKVKVKISSNAPNDRICLGTNVVFTAKTENPGLTPVYQWQLNGVNVGANSATYSNSTLMNRDTVRVVITSENTICEGPITSNSIIITIVSAPVTPTTIIGIDTLCLSSNAAYKVNEVPSADAYDWIVSGNMTATTSFSNVLNTLGGSNVGYAAIKVRAKNFCGISDYSAEFNVTITNPQGPNANFNMNKNSICVGNETINFTDASVMNSTTNSPIINYEWDFGDGSPIDNSQNITRTYNSDRNHNIILTVKSQDNCFASFTQSIYVHPLSVAGTIITDDSLLCSGNTSSLILDGHYGAIKWLSKPSNGGISDWREIPGIASDTLKTEKLLVSSDYKAEVTSGSCPTVASNSFKVTVKHPPTINVFAPNDVSDKANYFILKYNTIYDDSLNNWKPNAYNLEVSESNPRPNFNADNNYRLTDSILKITLPQNVKIGKYDFRISTVELPRTCSESELTFFRLWVGTPELSYKTPDTFKLDKGLYSSSPRTNLFKFSSNTHFKISPSLPTGLTIDSVTGVINGTPSSLSSPTSYVVTGEVFSRTITATVLISVVEEKPDSLQYKTPNVFILDSTITSLTPTSKGGLIRSFSINKALPPGLKFDTATGVISGTPTAIFSRTSYEIIAKNTAGSDTCTVVITVAIRPLLPIVQSARFILGKPGMPRYLNAFVNPLPSGIIPVWCNNGTQNCSQEVKATPTIIGKYIYQIRAYDTANQLYSTFYVNDTIIIAPDTPQVIDSTFVYGVKNNPTNIGVQVLGIDSARFNFYYSGVLQIGTPEIGSFFGTRRYAVSQTVNNVESDTVHLNTTVYDPTNMIHLQNIIGEGVLQSNLTYNFPVTLILTNQTNLTFSNIILSNNILRSVPSSSEFNIYKISAAGGLKVNKSFNGNSNINLTLSTSTLAPFAKDTSRFILNIRPRGFSGNINNVSFVNADTKWGTIIMQSSSTSNINDKTKSSTEFKINELKISIPEGFSPNNDGINDYFIIVKPYNTIIDLEVFNKSGNIVFSKKNYNNDWNGRGNLNYSERDLEDNGYFYNVKATDESGKVQVFKGFIIIQR